MPGEIPIQQVRKLVDDLEEHVDARRFYPRNNVVADRVLLALLSKAIRVAGAALALVQEGYFEEAFGLTRTLVDLHFTARYVANKDTIDRAEQFVNFFAKTYAGWVKIIEKFYPHHAEGWAPHHREMLELARDYKDPNHWTGMGDQTRRMAEEPSTAEHRPDGTAVTAVFDYEMIYKWTSHFVHPTVAALEAHAGDPASAWKVFADGNADRTVRFKDLALFNVLSQLATVTTCVFRGLGATLPPKISDPWSRLLNGAAFEGGGT